MEPESQNIPTEPVAQKSLRKYILVGVLVILVLAALIVLLVNKGEPPGGESPPEAIAPRISNEQVILTEEEQAAKVQVVENISEARVKLSDKEKKQKEVLLKTLE